MKIRDEDIAEALTGDGVSLDRWFAPGDHLVGHFDEAGRLMAKIMENDALAASAAKFLRKRGQVHDLKHAGSTRD